MKLRFHPRDDLLVRVPGFVPRVGQPDQYVGRRFDAEKHGHPASPTAYEVDADSDAGRRLAKLCRRDNALWPADKATADFCGVTFVPVEFQDGVFVPKSAGAQAHSKVEPIKRALTEES